MNKLHFISGLPRSGSTLLSSVLKQNPKFHASITDTLCTMVKGVIETSQNGPGMKFEVPEQRRADTVIGMVQGFYKQVDRPVIFNTNRAWTLLTPQIARLFPESKLIVCVRDIKWILDSFEVAHRKNPLTTNTATGGLDGTVYSRVDNLMTETGIVGFPFIGLKQAITSEESNRIFLVEYDELCKNPELIFRSLYSFIDEEYFQHDFNNVEGSWDEYDSEIGISLHTVKKTIEYKPRKSILPPDILAKYSNMEVWK
jgi:sulfotransferase